MPAVSKLNDECKNVPQRGPLGDAGMGVQMSIRTRYKQLLAACALTVGLALAGVAFTAPAAEAATGRNGAGGSLNVRSGPQVTSSILGSIPRGATITLVCYVPGGKVQGPWGASTLWDRIDLGGGRSGYVADALVITGSMAPIVPSCDAQKPSPQPPAPSGGSREAKALASAKSMLGNTSMGGLCEAFVEKAYGKTFRFANAIGHYQWQNARGRIHKDRNAPAGALVFYSSKWDSGNGHVAISEGNGKVVTTVWPGQPIVERDLGWLPGYLGWSYAP